MRVFVYGSLKRGYALHDLLAMSKFTGYHTTVPHYRIYDLGSYPGLIEVPDGLPIHGEVYDVSDETLKLLDDAEGVHEGWYARRSVRLQDCGDQPETHAWFWLKSVTGCPDCGQSWPRTAKQ